MAAAFALARLRLRSRLRPLIGLVFAFAFVFSGVLRAYEAAYAMGGDDMCYSMSGTVGGGTGGDGGDGAFHHQCCDHCLSPGFVPTLPPHAAMLAPRRVTLGGRAARPRLIARVGRRAGSTRSRAPPIQLDVNAPLS
ncbi:MAG: DUF2946 family protein [Hyphomicrobiaceae bacterium]|nr:DUF2946 family protein [Hyphomicrobiaceae bacterium]